MLKVTDEIREAARRLLERHNAAEPARAEARYQEGLASAQALAERAGRRVNEAHVRAEANRERWADKQARRLLEVVVEGRRKLIDEAWWTSVHGDVDKAKLDKLAALADPARNANEHERRVASSKLAETKPGLRDSHAKRAAERAAARAGLTCQQCGKPLNARRPTARFCSATCRSRAWRADGAAGGAD